MFRHPARAVSSYRSGPPASGIPPKLVNATKVREEMVPPELAPLAFCSKICDMRLSTFIKWGESQQAHSRGWALASRTFKILVKYEIPRRKEMGGLDMS